MLSNITGIGYQWSVGSDGWTNFSPSKDTKIVYVANNGNDSWSGLYPDPTPSVSPTDGPVATPSVGFAKLANNHPDWLLFRNGDTWTSAATLTGNQAGRGEKELKLISSYSSPTFPSTVRPLFIQTDNVTPFISFIQGSGSYMAVVGLNIYASANDPSSPNFSGATIIGDTTAGSNIITNIATIPAQVIVGVSIQGTGFANYTVTAVGTTTVTMNANASFNATQIPIQTYPRGASTGIILNGLTSTFILENCQMQYCGLSLSQNDVLQPPPVKMYLRRNIIQNPWQINGGACFFIGPTNDIGATGAQIHIQENVLDHGGWNETVWIGGSEIFTHNMYLHNPSVPFNLDGNIVSNGSATGDQHREGGTVSNNLFISNPTQHFSVPFTQTDVAANNVFHATTDMVIGGRFATQVSTSGTTLFIDGTSVSLNAGNIVGYTAVNLSNPNSIPTGTTVSSINTTGKSVTLSSAIVAGQRNNGVQIGDKIRFMRLGTCIGIQINRAGTQVSAGPGSQPPFLVYSGPSTVSISSGTAVVSESSVATGRSTDDPFQFTSGTLPPELSLNTTYWALDTGQTYRIAATQGGSPITTSTTASGVVRTGAKLLLFNQAAFGNSPILLVPSYVNVGSKLQVGTTANAYSGGFTTVASIAADRTSLITTDPITLVAGFPGAGQADIIFDAPTTTHYPTARYGPGNILINGRYSSTTPGAAITLSNQTFQIDASSNYIYNWNMNTTTGTVTDSNTDPTYSATNNITQTVNLTGQTIPQASVEAYHASLQNNQFTGSITPNGTGLGTLTVTSGSSPAVGDTIFDVNFANLVPQYCYVLSGSGSTFLVAQRYGSISSSVASTTMISGSNDGFIALAATNSRASWNTSYTAAACNNYIRTALGLPTI